MINDIYKQAISALTAEKAQAEEKIRQKVMQEIIIPHNTEVDKKLAEATRELTEKHNNKILSIQNEFNAEKQRFVDLANAEKKDFAEKTINAECQLVRIEYEQAIDHIRVKLQENEA